MELHLTPELEAHLSRMAEHEGKTTQDLILEAARRVVESDQHHMEVLDRRIELADRGDFLTEEEMDVRFRALIAS